MLLQTAGPLPSKGHGERLTPAGLTQGHGDLSQAPNVDLIKIRIKTVSQAQEQSVKMGMEGLYLNTP